MRTHFAVSDEQWAAICAPRAGRRGRRRRLRQDDADGGPGGLPRRDRPGAPDQVLGLTFTTKAAAELAPHPDALSPAGRLPTSARPDDERLEPTVSTYNAYAAWLLTEHGLRIGHEPDTRVMADASRYQLGGPRMARHVGRVRLLTDSPRARRHLAARARGAMSEHLVDADDVRAFDARARRRSRRSSPSGRRPIWRKVIDAIDERARAARAGREYRRLKPGSG